MCSSTRMLLAEFLGTWLYLTLGGLGTLHTPYLPALTWAVALTVGSLLGGHDSHLNPAVTLGLTAAGRSKLASLPGRLVGQFLGAYVAGMTLVGVAPVYIVERMVGDTNHTALDWAEPWLTLPQYGATLYLDILTFTIAAIMFQLLISSCAGSALYQGISLGAVILTMGSEIGAGLNPAREIMGRLVVSFYHWNWDIFLYYDIWAWIPLVWSISGCITASLIHWLLIEVPGHVEKNKKEEQEKIEEGGGNGARGELSLVMEEKPLQLVTIKPPVPPPQPPRYENSYTKSSPTQLRFENSSTRSTRSDGSNGSTPPQLRSLLREKPTRSSAIQKYCRKNNISTTDLNRYLERYQSVSLDKVDPGHEVTVKVNDKEVDN